MIYNASRFIFEWFIRIFFKLKIYGPDQELKPPFIVVSNHASLLDPPIVALPVKPHRVDFMAKKELFEMPVVGAWTRRTGCIKVYRSSGGAGSLKEAYRRLNSGNVVGLFPEGSRSKTGEMLPMKKGAGFLVGKTKVPVLPVYLKNSGNAFSGKLIKFGTPIEVHVGKLLTYQQIADSLNNEVSYEAIASLITDKIETLKEEASPAGS